MSESLKATETKSARFLTANVGGQKSSTCEALSDPKEILEKGGDQSIGNLRLLCAKHNRFEAENVYGREFMNNKFQPCRE